MDDIFRKKWIDQAFEKIKMVHPNDNDNQILDYLNNVYDKSFKDTPCRIYNNYEKEEINTTIHNVTN